MTSQRLREALDALNGAREARLRVIEPSRDLFTPVEPEPEPWDTPASMSDQWRDHALEVVRQVALEHRELTVEDVAPRVTQATYDRRALGNVMVLAARKGWIKRVGWVGGGSSRHGRPVALWASRLYRDGAA